MKRTIIITLIILILLPPLALVVFTKPLIIFIAKKQLQQVFAYSTVKIDGCAFEPFKQLSLSGIRITKEPLYDLGAKRITLDFTPDSLLKRKIAKVTLEDLSANIDSGKKSILQFKKHLNLGTGNPPFSLANLELDTLKLNIKSAELNTRAQLSLKADLIRQKLDKCSLNIDSLESLGVTLTGASMDNLEQASGCRLNVEKIKYDKAKMSRIKANARLEGKRLYLDSFSADLFAGRMQGNISFKLDKVPEYEAGLEFIDLDLDAFVNDFKLQEKVRLSGKLNGAVILRGRGNRMEVVSGSFKSYAPGGTMTIKDSRYLENLARQSGKSLDMLTESLTGYNYNTGSVELSLDKRNLVLNAVLEGDAGKRSLSVILHDFSLRREQ